MWSMATSKKYIHASCLQVLAILMPVRLTVILVVGKTLSHKSLKLPPYAVCFAVVHQVGVERQVLRVRQPLSINYNNRFMNNAIFLI